MQYTGTIRHFTDRGFGFIAADTDVDGIAESNDVFFHLKQQRGFTAEQLQRGTRVEFTTSQGRKGVEAQIVRIIGEAL